MAVQDKKQAVRRFYQEILNGRNLDAIEELVTPMGLITPSAARTPSRPSNSLGCCSRPFPTYASRSTT
jgi:hypothetical protein